MKGRYRGVSPCDFVLCHSHVTRALGMTHRKNSLSSSPTKWTGKRLRLTSSYITTVTVPASAASGDHTQALSVCTYMHRCAAAASSALLPANTHYHFPFSLDTHAHTHTRTHTVCTVVAHVCVCVCVSKGCLLDLHSMLTLYTVLCLQAVVSLDSFSVLVP